MADEELQEQTVEELKELAREYDLKVSGSKDELVQRISAFEAGVPVDEEDDDEDEVEVAEVQVEEDDEDEVEDEPEEDENQILVKMTRQNPSYEVRDKRFTQEHPYQLCTEEEANHIFRNYDGFRQAHPDEVKAFYG